MVLYAFSVPEAHRSILSEARMFNVSIICGVFCQINNCLVQGNGHKWDGGGPFYWVRNFILVSKQYDHYVNLIFHTGWTRRLYHKTQFHDEVSACTERRRDGFRIYF